MRPWRSLAVALLGAITALACGDAPVSASDSEALRPLDLRVAGNADAWHADNDFRLDWTMPPEAAVKIGISGIRYLVRDTAGNPIGPEVFLAGRQTLLEHLYVPSQPGAYPIELRLESETGVVGPAATTVLRFDDAPPAMAQPLLPEGWINPATTTILRIEHPATPQPISGIRGYAVSIDAGDPCATPNRCSEAETDLRGGIGGDTISLGTLPEGVHVVRTLAVSGSGVSSTQVGSALLRVDATRPNVELHGVPRGWASGPVRVTASASDSLSGMAAAGPNGPTTTIAVDDAVPKSIAGDSVTMTVFGSGTHAVTALARDGAGNVSGEEQGQPAAVLIDEVAPRVTFSESQDPAEPERIEARVADSLSGPDPARGAIAVRAAGTKRQFTPLPTLTSAGRLIAHWDSDAFPPGTYEFRAIGFDVAGNSATSGSRASGARMALASPLKKPTSIEAGFGGRRLTWHRCKVVAGSRRCRREVIESFARRPAERSVPYGRGMPLAGRLSSSVSPVAGLPVQIVETFDTGAVPDQRTTVVQTAADGTFIARLAPGPSRQVEAVFAGSPTLSRATGRQLRLAVLTGVRMRASTAAAAIGGAPVVFGGTVARGDAKMPPDGRAVELQFRLPGGEWAEFRTIQTDRHGRFRYAYEFSDDDSRGVRFEFRAFVPTQDGWPYEPAASRPVFVTGR